MPPDAREVIARRMKAYVEPDEVAGMERETTNLRDRLLIRLLFHSGCRISEALALAVEDVDFDHGTITIQHLKTRLKLSCTGCGQRLGRYHVFRPGCGSKVEKAQAKQQEHRRQRVLPVDGDTLSMLKDYIRRGGPVLRDGKKLIFGINRHRAWQIISLKSRIRATSSGPYLYYVFYGELGTSP